MTLDSDAPWLDPSRVDSTRLFVAQRLSGLSGQEPSYLRGDISNVRAAVDMVAEERSASWAPFYACDEVPPPSDGADDPAVQLAITRRNSAAADCSDGLIVHGGKNGSAFLGHLQRGFLEGPLPRPVAVLLHENDKDASRAWKGLQYEHPTLRVLRFDDGDLSLVLCDWLRERADVLDGLAVQRRELDEQWRPVCEALAKAIGQESDDTREALAVALNRTVQGVDVLVRRPMGVAALGAQHLMVLQQRYGDLMERSVVWASARALIAQEEWEAWRQWYDQVGPDRAWRTLCDEVRERQLEGVTQASSTIKPAHQGCALSISSSFTPVLPMWGAVMQMI